MADVIHVLKDGTRVDDIAGYIVRISDAEPVYNLMDAINKKVSINNERQRKNNRKD